MISLIKKALKKITGMLRSLFSGKKEESVPPDDYYPLF